MADQNVAGGDAVQTGDNAFTISGTQAGEVTLPNNLSVADADFSYDGSDLVLTFPDGTTVTVEGYSENPNPPTLVSSDGAQVGHDVVTQLTMADGAGDAPAPGGQFGFVQPNQAEQTITADQQSSGNIAENPNVIAGTDGEPIGNVESLNGEVFAIRVDGTRVRLELGDQVFQGDILESGPEGNVGVLLADQTTFAMGPEGRMVLDEMIYDPATQQGSVSMSVLQGVFTFVSGQVAKTDPDAMTLDTPVATIGIRGTQVGLDLRDGENLNVHLMEEREGFVGEVVIVNDGGVQVLNDANAFSSVASFDTAPSPFSIVSVEDIRDNYGAETLRYLPTRNSDGERTSANTYQNDNDNQTPNTDFLNDFQTDAGGPQQQAPSDTIHVAGDLVQFETINTVGATGPVVEVPLPSPPPPPPPPVDNVEEAPIVVPVEEDPYPDDIQGLITRGILTDVVISADGKTVTANVPGDFDAEAEGVDYTFVLTGTDGDNTITTGDGNDTLIASGGDDILNGGSGDDLFIAAPGAGDDTFDGGDGNDTITYAASDDNLTINLSAGTASDNRGAVGNDTILNIENVIGGSGNDTIIGDEFANILEGGGGDDFIDGREGMDTAVFSGTFGESTIRVVDGVLTVTGPDGTDTVENIENFAFTDSPNLIVGLEDTAMSLDVVDQVPAAETAASVVITGIPEGATLSAGTLLEDGSWLLDNADLDGLTLTGATNSAEDFSISITTYSADYMTALTQAASDYLADQLDPETNQPEQTLEDFLADGGSIVDLAGVMPESYLPQPSASGSTSIEVIAIVDPFTFTVDGVALTDDGAASTITFAGTEDTELPLNIASMLTDTDGSEVLSVTISGLPTMEVVEVSSEVPVLDANGQPVLDEAGNPVTETQTTFEPVTDANGNTVGAHLVYTDASGNDVVLPSNETGTYTLTAAQLNGLRLVGSPDDSAGFDLDISAQVQDGESTATVFGSATVTLAAKADVPTVSGGAETTLEDQPVHINFDIDKNDISEHITDITLTGIPDGAKLSIAYTDPDTGETFQVPLQIHNGEANIPLGFLDENMSTDGLVMTPPANVSGSFDMQLNVTSTEPTNGDTATNHFNMPLTLTAVADELGVTINETQVVDGDTVTINAQEDGAFALDISAMTEDQDGSEVISVTISGVPEGATLSAGTENTDGTWTLTPEEFSDLSITPAPDSDVNFDLTVTVTNVDNNEDTNTLQATVSVDVTAIADAANLTASDVVGLEDTPIALDIASSLNDTDGSESLSITISDVPDGATLSAGTNNGDGSWTLSADQLDGLTITPGLNVSGEFNLTVTATTTEAANGDTATVTQQIGLSVTPDADAPTVNVTAVTGNEDAAIPLNIDAALVDTDGSETLSITIAGVPEGAVLSAGTNLGNGIWDVAPGDLAGLTITPTADSNEDFSLSVTATSTESNGEFAETTAEIPVTLLGVADAPTLVADEVVGLEGTPIALNIDASLSDTDGSETLSITIENIPSGAFLLSGGDVIAIQDGVAHLTGDQLADLSILPPSGSVEDFDLMVTATSTENDNDLSANGQGVSSVSGTLSVTVQEQADTPSLMLFDAAGNEDTPVPLNIAAILTDPGETLSVTVSGIPEGVTLSAGTYNEADDTWTLEAGDLNGLTMNLADNSAADFSVQVTATSTTDDGTFAETSGSLNVSIAGVADEANLNLTDVSADEGTAVPLNIDASLVDTDGSETLSITLSNIPEGSVLSNAAGDVLSVVDGAAELTPAQLAGLTMITPAGMDTDFTLLVTATTTEDDNAVTANGQGTASVSGVINVDMQAVAEVPTLVLQDASGNEDQPIALDISAFVADPSETVSITIAGVPDGAVLSAGSNNNDGTWTLTPAQLADLTITPPADSNENFQLEITATSTEQDGTSASSSGSISIGVTGVADAPTLNTENVSGLEDGAIPLNISANLADTDGSESLSITIEGVPVGATLSAGTHNPDGSWTLSGDQLSNLTMTPPADASGNFSLMVTATSTENDGDSSSVTGLMNVNVDAVADAPTLILHDAAGFEDDAIPLEISTEAAGGDEIVGITISGVPTGATLSAGTDNGDGTWTLDSGDLSNLTITPPLNTNANFNLSVTVTSMDGNDMAESSQALNVSVTAVADKPTLDVPAQISVDGQTATDLDIHSALTDMDGSESLSINVSNIPEGAVLNIGNTVLTVVGGSIDLQPSQLSGLQITPPPGFDGNFTLQVTATSTDTDPDSVIPNGLETNVSIGFIDVEVDGANIPDAPDLTLNDTQGFEDQPIALDIDAALTDPTETLSITISGVPEGAVLSAGTDLGNGTWSLLPEEAAGLTVTPPADSNVDFALNVTATSTTPEGDIATTTGTVNVDVVGVADQPNLSVSIGEPITVDPSEGVLSTQYPLDISSSLNDVDGSETLSISISDLPEGVTLSAGVQGENGTWTLGADDLSGLTITVPLGVNPDFDFNITATSTENDGDTASVSTTVGVDGDDLASAPDLAVSAAEGNEDSAIELDVSAALTDTDGSETLSITISGVPNGAELSAGIDNHDGSWTLTPEQLTGLTVQPPVNSDGDFTLTVTATSLEASTGDTAVTTGTLDVTVNAVADAPGVAAGDGSGDVGQTVPLEIQSLLIDTDGSESLSITIAGFPEGATLNAGTDNLDGSYTLSAADLEGLAISLPEGASDDFDLSVTATSTEASNNDQASTVVTASINVDPLANDDHNMVQIGDVTTGNVLTGQGDSVDPTAAADVGSTAGNSVVDVSFGGVTKSFNNPDDVSSDADGNYVEIAGEHGTLKMYADGSYDYAADDSEAVSQVAGLTGTASPQAVEEAWSGVQTFAFDFGTSYVDGNGQFDPSLADAEISFTAQGIGVAGTQGGMPAPDQINHDNETGQSEALGLNLGSETHSATLTVSNMFTGEDGGEEGHWQAFDASGNLVGEGDLNASTVDYSGSNNIGTTEISLPDGASFQYLVFTATDTGNDTDQNDSSDFFIRAVQFESNETQPGEDLFSYTMQDADGDTASATLTINVAEEQDTTASDPTLNATDAAGLEDSAIPLDISAGLGDLDGSESLSITIGGVPVGASLNAGTDNHDGTWTVSPEDLGDLTITPPSDSNEDFALTVTATSTEANGGDTSSTTATINVAVTGVADAPGATAEGASGVEDQWVALNLDSAMSSDTDGSETLSITISGVPEGAQLSAGSLVGNGVWTVSAADLPSVSMLPPANFSGEMAMSLSVTSTENDGDTATTEVPFTVSVTGDADAPTVTIGDAAGLEDTEIPLNVSAILGDTDGSESLSITISNVPAGAVLSAGTDNHDGTWTLGAGDLDGLTVKPPFNSNEDMQLSVSATATEANGDTATTTATMNVAVTGVADAPTLNVSIGEGVVEMASSDITITNMGEVSAGYNNSYGYYVKDAEGNPSEGMVIWSNAKEDIGDTFTIEGVDPDSIGFFIIPNGGDNNQNLGGETPVTFVQDQNGNWNAVDANGQTLTSTGGTVLFSDPALNDGNFDYAVDNSVAGNQNWEDLRGGGDHDFNDVNVNVEVTPHNGSDTVEYPLNISSLLTDTDGSESLSITVDGLPAGAQLSAGTQNGDGSWTLSSGQLTGLTMTVAADSGDFQLEVTATSTENDGDTASVSTTVGVEVPTYDTTADGADLSAGNANGLEDSDIPLDIASSLHDTDGSESLSITISGMPNGATLSAGTDNHDGTWTLSSEQLTGLTVKPPTNSNEDFTLNVTATSTESASGETASTSTSFTVGVTGVADAPTLTAALGQGTVHQSEPVHTDPTTVFSSNFGQSDVGFVQTLDGWSTNSDAIETWDSSSGETGDGGYIELNDDAVDYYADATSINRDFPTVEGATYTLEFRYSPRPGYDADTNKMDIRVNGEALETVSADGSNNDDNVWQTQTITFVGTGEPMNLEFISTGEAEDYGRGMRLDDVVLTEQAPDEPGEAVSVEYPLDITSSLRDTDGSETLSITVGGLPEGATLSAGTDNNDGTWTLSPLQLAGLSMTVAIGTDDFQLEVTATSTENDGDIATVTTSVGVELPDFDTTADGADLTAGNVSGYEDTAIALDIASSLHDTDGSESLSITISGVPTGASLSAGTDNHDGTWTLSSDQLDGLSVTPPTDSNEDFTLNVTATSTESATGETSTQTASFNVDVTGVADGVSVSASATAREGHTSSPDPAPTSSYGSGHGSGHGSWNGSGHGDGDGTSGHLVALFEVSDDDNNQIENSAGSNEGTLHGVTINHDSDGPSGSSAVFDGNNDYVEVDHSASMEMNSGTFVLWFNTENADDKQALFSKDSSGYDDGGHVTAFVDDGQVKIRLQSQHSSYTVEGGDVSSGAWHQMAFSFGAGGMNLYVDGTLVDHDNYTGGMGGNEEPLIFGANQWSSGNHVANNLQDFFSGQMDKIAVYNSALSLSEISAMHDAGVAQINDGSDALVYDLDIQGTLVDIDGSESLSFEVRGLPDGVALSAGHNDGNGTWTLTAADLTDLTLTVEPSVSDDFSIDVVAIGTENDGDSAESPIVSLDISVATADPVEITGTWQDESLGGGSGDDNLSGNDGNDELYGHNGDDILNGGTGNDSLFGDAGDDVMDGGNGNDSLFGGAGNDTMDGGTDHDYMAGGDGNDVMNGGNGNDVMFGGAGNDAMNGGTDSDTMDGGTGDDHMDGGSGNDVMAGGDGNDTIDGGTGNDIINGGQGNDVLTGGDGSDTFQMNAESGHDIIQDIMDQDTIVFEGQQFHAEDMIFNENDEGNVVVSFAGVEGQSVTLNGVSMDDLDQNQDGNPSDGYTVTETDGHVTLTIDTPQ